MRNLQIVDEFRTEAANSLFNKAQAMSITMRLLQLELEEPDNSEEDKAVLVKMLSKFNFGYLDGTMSRIDMLLDSANVARITADDILKSIEAVKFDCM